MKKDNFLITGAAGFIGFSLARKMIKKNNVKVIGIDNINNYYDKKLKIDRLKVLLKSKNFKFYKINICDKKKLNFIFSKYNFKKVFNLAAQAGVRYSLLKPESYIESNLLGFFNILEACKKYKTKHLIYASSSSVYGVSKKFPFSEENNCSHPIQLYAATKRSNELMAHSYSSLFKIPTSGVRFFTAYGPWGRPDQALFKFTKNILENKKIQLYNRGEHYRDFTYIDDLIDGIIKISNKIPKNKNFDFKKTNPGTSYCPYEIYNIGSNKVIYLKHYVKLIENYLNKKAKISLLPLQKGDIVKVSSNISKVKKLNFKPKTSVAVGVKKFIDWYKIYYKIK